MVFTPNIPKEQGYYWVADKEYPVAKPCYLYFGMDSVPMITGFDRTDDFSPTWYRGAIFLFGDKIDVPDVDMATAG